jgi:hypothetical protein
MPNTLCEDGVTMAGPGDCVAKAGGGCGWEIIECPPSPDKESCGGFAGKLCPEGKSCVDDPSDDCDPAKGGADCMGICEEVHACGGIAGFRCPDGMNCVDDPNDSCDPKKGGADCMGVCRRQ